LADVAETGDVEGAVDASCLPGIKEVEVRGDFIDDFGGQGKRITGSRLFADDEAGQQRPAGELTM
jgi:hypothetical protein